MSDDTHTGGIVDQDYRLCPFCAEPIRAAAIKCKHCGEFLDRKPPSPVKWYFKPSFLIAAILLLGPLSLPLVWFKPDLSRRTKWIITIVVLVLSYVLGIMVVRALRSIYEYYELLYEVYQ